MFERCALNLVYRVLRVAYRMLRMLSSSTQHRLALSLLGLVILISCRPKGSPAPTVFPPATPEVVDGFDFPLDPSRYGPSIPDVTGPHHVDTRFGAQNPALGNDGKCFKDRNGTQIPFRELYHAGEDWFQLGSDGQVDGSGAAGDPVRAVANGVVYQVQEIGSQGYIVVLEHLLPDGQKVYSAYWHVAQPQVGLGGRVSRGDVIAMVHDQWRNSHLHWEIRTFGDGSRLFPSGSAGERGTCNGKVAGVAYTWDDDPARARPEYWGYLHPTAFIQQNRP